MKKIAIINRKGGVGKSTICVNLAHAFAKIGYKVLLLDLDSQNDSALFLGITKDRYKKTFFDLFDRHHQVDFQDCIINARENLDILPNEHIEQIDAELNKFSRIDCVFREKLKGLDNLGYDYLFVDCSPSRNKINDAVLCYTDHIIMPVQLQAASVRAVGNIYEYLADLYLPADLVRVVIPNMFNAVTNDSKENLDFLQDFYRDQDILTEPIYTRTKISEAGKAGKTIFEYDPEAAEQFLKVFRKVVDSIA